MKLIKTDIREYQDAAQFKQEEWLKDNRQKADSTREFASMLGMLEPSGLPKKYDKILEQWQTRLYLLEYRIKNLKEELEEEALSKIAKMKLVNINAMIEQQNSPIKNIRWGIMTECG